MSADRSSLLPDGSPAEAIRVLIDGRPDDSRERIERRARWLVIISAILANLGGALVVFFFTTVVIPDPIKLSDPERVTRINTLLFTIYLIGALPVGALLGLRFFRRIRGFVAQERPLTEQEQLMLLRSPLRLMAVHGILWGIGTVGWTAIDAYFSPLLAAKVGLTCGLGALTTCTIVYLVTERLLRPAVTAALSAGVPQGTGLPGVVARSILAWALGAAVPVLGLLSVAIMALGPADIGPGDLVLMILTLGGTSLIVGLGITYIAARAVADPVESVRLALARVQAGDLEAEVPVYDGSEIGLLQAGFNHMVSGLREHERLQDLFGRQVGEDVARVALERGIDLDGELAEVAVIFVDLVGSTRLAATRPPAEVVRLLNGFFAIVVEVIGRHGGWINKFEGDAALAIFGAPLPIEDAPGRALAAARDLAERLRAADAEVQAAIGVSAGEAVAGHIGAEQRYEYTVIGDPVNEAARLTDLAKSTPQGVLASGRAVAAARPAEAAQWRIGEEVLLRGRTEPTRLATPLPQGTVPGTPPGTVPEQRSEPTNTANEADGLIP